MPKHIAPLKASEMIAKHLGGFIERKEVGGPGEFDKLTDELDKRIREEAEFLAHCKERRRGGSLVRLMRVYEKITHHHQNYEAIELRPDFP